MKQHAWAYKISIGLICLLSFEGFGFSGGTGLPGDPYKIATPADLSQVISYLSSSFILVNDIDLQNAAFTTFVGGGIFSGNFNGNGYSILNYSVTNANGFFTVINGTVRNLSLINAVYTSSSGCGGLANSTGAGALIEHCYIECSITSAGTHHGGLIGINHGTIRRCGAVADITETGSSIYSNMGGLVGHNYGAITDCYARARLTGECIVGGFAGYNTADGQITNCYSSSVIENTGHAFVNAFAGYTQQGTLTDCFWDTDAAAPLTAGADPETGLTGLDTAAMQTQASFTGWDFVGSGGDEIWTMSAGAMPILTWQADGRYCIDPPLLDANGDCLVNLTDLAVFAQQWLTCGYANQALCPY